MNICTKINLPDITGFGKAQSGRYIPIQPPEKIGIYGNQFVNLSDMYRYADSFQCMNINPAFPVTRFQRSIIEMFVDGFNFKPLLDNQFFNLEQFDILHFQVNIINGNNTQAGILHGPDQYLAIIKDDGILILAISLRDERADCKTKE